MATDDDKWRNLETKLAEAIDSVILCEDGANIVSALGLLDGVLRFEPALPEKARERAGKLQRMLRPPAGFELGMAAKVAVGERHAWLEAMPQESKRALAAALTSLLRFVCHRGNQYE